MALIKSKPTSPGRRFRIKISNADLHKGKPHESLIAKSKKSGGRNNQGRITTRHIGGGHKKRYRIIDFHRNKIDMTGIVERIEYDPNRSSHIALISYEDKTKTYIICPQNINVGDKIVSGLKKEVKIGNCMPLSDIPPGTQVHNVELNAGAGGKLARSAGASVILSGIDDEYAIIKLSSLSLIHI